jgi:hypothetical protein
MTRNNCPSSSNVTPLRRSLTSIMGDVSPTPEKFGVIIPRPTM